jgi:carboxylate-amine ligase
MSSIEVIPFRPSANPLTLGVELELQVLDARSLRLTPRAPEVLDRAHDLRLDKEMFRSTIELVTGICSTAREAVDDLRATLLNVRKVSDPLGLRFAGTGTHPLADYNDRLVSESERYQQLLDRNQWLIRRMAVYGLHVHVGLPSGDACVRYMNAFLALVPHLIALSASSPFWRGMDTGLCASRPTVYEAHPTSGLPVLVRDWAGFNAVYADMLRTGSIKGMKDIWWDLRPSPAYGTLEVRVCDRPATMAEAGAITAFIHANAAHLREVERIEEGPPPELPVRWVLRENKWRALRYGLDASVIDARDMSVRPLRDALLDRLVMLEPFFRAHGDEDHLVCLRDICTRGNSSDRQRAEHARTGHVEDVVRFNVREFEAGAPLWA